MMQFDLSVLSAEEETSAAHLDTLSDEQTLALGGLTFTLRRTRRFALDELELSFIPQRDLALRCISLTLPFAQNAIGGALPIYAFNNELCTNAFPRILRLDAPGQAFRSRELVTARSEKGALNAAFTTFDRFFTDFHTSSDGICANWHMEDKTVHAGQRYTLELLALDDARTGLDFFEAYTQTLHDRYSIRPPKPTPAGWSSWSCYYSHINEDKIAREATLLAKDFRELGADLIQIDDGWQREGSFGAYWLNDEKTFPHDMPALAEHCRELGLRLGLWMAPGLLRDTSSRFEELRPILSTSNGQLIRHLGGGEKHDDGKDGSVYGMDLSKPRTTELAVEMFRRGKEEYHSEYFKIDFLVCLLLRMGYDGRQVVFDSDEYAVELYRRYIRTIRETVGDDVFLLACGAPIGESVGIFDAIRISADIAWSTSDPGHPGTWAIIRNAAQSAVLRSPFHEKVFINDPDALLVRDFLTENCNDGVALTLEEARMWATVIAMSGGHVLINEELERLDEERKALFANILPPMGKAARPKDFYEYPWCSESFIRIDDDTVLCALYNWGDEPLCKEFRTADYVSGCALLVDCWTHEPFACVDSGMTFELPAHTARAFLVKALPSEGGFLYSNENFHLGYGREVRPDTERFFYFPDGAPDGYSPVPCSVTGHLYKKD